MRLPDVILLAAICSTVLAISAQAADQAGTMWDGTVMQQPFDSEPFRRIVVPDWLWDITSHVFYAHGDERSFDEAASAGAQMGEFPIGDPKYAYYDTTLLPRDPSVAADYVAKIVSGYKKRDMRVIAAIPPWILAPVYYAHPEWRAIDTNTTVVPELDQKTNPYGGRLCLLGGWGDYLIDVLADFLAKYPDVDGFCFDGIHHFVVCYCQHCRDAYRQDTGLEIPNVDMNDPVFRRYVYWEDRQLEAMIERMQKRLKSIKPDVALVTWTTNAGRFGQFLTVPRTMSTRMNLLFDAPDQEFWMEETHRGNTVAPAFANAYMWAVTDHRVAFSEPYLISHSNPCGTDSFPPHEMMRRALLALTYGANPAISLGWPNRRNAGLDCVKAIHRRAPWLVRKQPEKWAALVMSDVTRDFYGRELGKVEERYLSNVLGAFRAGIEEHLPITVINDWNLNPQDLSGYKVLIMPNTACLNEEQASAVREFVTNGGGLVASVDTSLFDEMGEPRKDFALADVFGVHYAGLASTEGGKGEQLDSNFEKAIGADYWEKHKSIFDFRMGKHPMFDDPRLVEYLGDLPVAFKGQAVAVTGDADTVGTITSREPNARPVPAVVARVCGKGRVVYLPAGFDSAYYMYSFPYERLVLAGAIRWAARDALPITVDAPMCVHATFMRQTKDGQRLVVHLYNDLNSTGNHAKPDEDVPLREEVVPIHDIKVAFKGYDIRRVHLEPEGVELKTTKMEDGIQITVPRLDIHSMVVAELAGPRQ